MRSKSTYKQESRFAEDAFLSSLDSDEYLANTNAPGHCRTSAYEQRIQHNESLVRLTRIDIPWNKETSALTCQEKRDGEPLTG
jgi:hypothetical protein